VKSKHESIYDQIGCNVDPAYAAPEVLEQTGLPPQKLTKADSYSLPVIVYETLEWDKAGEYHYTHIYMMGRA